jgi:ribonucleoside-diphosphate reductase beta chain
MERQKLFDPTGDDSLETRSIIGGHSTNILNLNNVRFRWAPKLYRTMLENFWVPEKVDLSGDKESYKKLTPDEEIAYDEILSFLIFLDSIQTNNIGNINDYITAPEVKVLLAIHQYQEAIHSQSYQYIIETIVAMNKRNLIYDYWRKDDVLLSRNSYIANIYQAFLESQTDANFAKVLIANYLLEGLYFYNGFNFFYNLASRDLMLGTAEIIRYIQRDELTHCLLFEFIIKEIKRTRPTFFDEEVIEEMVRQAVDQEITWTNHIVGNKILGVSEETTDQYTKWLANDRWRKLGFKGQLYKGYAKNPYKHLEAFADTGGQGSVKSNFFESSITSYNLSSAVEGWNDF